MGERFMRVSLMVCRSQRRRGTARDRTIAIASRRPSAVSSSFSEKRCSCSLSRSRRSSNATPTVIRRTFRSSIQTLGLVVSPHTRSCKSGERSWNVVWEPGSSRKAGGAPNENEGQDGGHGQPLIKRWVWAGGLVRAARGFQLGL